MNPQVTKVSPQVIGVAGISVNSTATTMVRLEHNLLDKSTSGVLNKAALHPSLSGAAW